MPSGNFTIRYHSRTAPISIIAKFAGGRGVVHLERRLVLLRLRRWEEVRGAAAAASVADVRLVDLRDGVDAVGGEKGTNFELLKPGRQKRRKLALL